VVTRRAGTRATAQAVFERATEIISAEFSRALQIEEVARRVAVSPRQLQRVFSEVEGTGFRTYLCETRMSRAVALLASTDLPVKEVGARIGYRDASQFGKAFKRVHGISPSEARMRSRARGPSRPSGGGRP
jgi:AraC-like DNA-binding protein